MGFWSKLIGGGAGATIEAIRNTIDMFMETDDERRAFQLVKEKIKLKRDEMQAEINRVEAMHSSLFVSGWRPFVGWVCGFGLAAKCILMPFMNWCVIVFANPKFVPPAFEVGDLIGLLLALLGMSGLRSYEKKGGVAR